LKLFLVGYYGFGNAGDECLLQKSVALLRQAFPTCHISILYGEATFPSFLDVQDAQCVPRQSIWKVLKGIRQSEMVVFGGGSIFQDVTSSKSFWYYAALLAITQWFGRKSVLLGQGIGPLRWRVHQWIFKQLCRRVSAISVRDKEALKTLQEWKIQNVTEGSDLSFFEASYNIQTGTQLGLSLRPFHGNARIADQLRSFLDPLIEQATVMTLQTNVDLNYISQLTGVSIAKLQKNAISVRDVLPKINASENTPSASPLKMVIAMRYHACVYAALRGVPFLALGYDKKVLALAASLGQPSIDLSREATAEKMTDALASFVQNWQYYQNKLSDRVPKLITKASAHLTLFRT